MKIDTHSAIAQVLLIVSTFIDFIEFYQLW